MCPRRRPPSGFLPLIHNPFLSAAIDMPRGSTVPQDSAFAAVKLSPPSGEASRHPVKLDQSPLLECAPGGGDDGEMHVAAAPHGSAFAAVPPQGPSQHPAPANKVVFRGVQSERDSTDQETRIKIVKGIARKREIIKDDLEIKAEEAEIQNFRRSDAEFAGGISQTRHMTRPGKYIYCMRMDMHQPLHVPANMELDLSQDNWYMNNGHQTDESEVLKLKHQTFMEGGTSASQPRSSKCEDIKAKVVQTDIPDLGFHVENFDVKKILLASIGRISSNLSDNMGRLATSLLGTDLISKVLISCMEEISMLNHSKASSSMDDVIQEISLIIIKYSTAFFRLLQRRMDRLEDENKKLRTEIEVAHMSRDLLPQSNSAR